MSGIGIRLQLIADFGRVAAQAKSDLKSIAQSFDTIKESATGIKSDGFKDLLGSITGVKTEAAAARASVSGLTTDINALNKSVGGASKTTKSLLSDLVGMKSSVGGASGVIKDLGVTLETMGGKAQTAGRRAKQSIDDIASSAKSANEPLLRLSTTMTKIGDSAVIVDRAGNAFTGLAAQAKLAMDEVNRVDASILRLPSMKRVIIAIETRGGNQPQLPPWTNGQVPRTQPTNWNQGGRSDYARDPGQTMLPRDRWGPRATVTDNGNFTPYVESPIPLPGGVDPAYAPPRQAPNLGSQGWINNGRSTMRAGDQVSSAGIGAAVNGGILIEAGAGPIEQAFTNNDIIQNIKETLAHKGASESSSNAFIGKATQGMTSVGGNYQSNLAGLINFVSGLPLDSVNFNDPKQATALAAAYQKIVKLTLTDSAAGGSESTGTMTGLTLATAKNFGFPMNNPESVQQGIDFATNYLVQMKNKTNATAGQAAQTFKTLGPIEAMQGIKPEELVGISGILAQSNVTGSQAGNQMKRIFTRQAMDPAALKKLQAFVEKASHGKFSLDQYKEKDASPLDFIANIANFERDYLNPKDKDYKKNIAGINATVAGGYAIPALGDLTNFARQTKGKNGQPVTDQDVKDHLANYGKELLYGQPQGAKPGEKPLDTTYRKRMDENPKQDVAKTKGLFDDEMRKDVKEMVPELKDILAAVDGLIKGFSGLPEPVKKFALEGAIMGAVLLATVGVIGILAGNFIKLGGAFVLVGGGALRFIEVIMGLEKGKIAAGIIEKITGIVPKAGTAIMEAFGVIAPRAMAMFGASFLGIPIIGWIAALVLAGVGLYEAWTNDWGGIREHTASVLSWLGDALKNVGGWMGDFAHSGQKMASDFIKGLTGGFTSAVGNVKSALKKIGDLFPHSPPPDGSSPLAGQAESGQIYANQFIDGALSAFFAGGPKIKKALKPISDSIIYMKSESILQVEAMGKAIEASMDKIGTKYKTRRIILVDPVSGDAAAVSGSLSAYNKAAVLARGTGGKYNSHGRHGEDDPDDAVKAGVAAEKLARAFMEKFFGEIGTGGGLFGKVDKGLASEGQMDQRYGRIQGEYQQRLQNQIRMQKNPDDASKKELDAQMETEVTERRLLSAVIDEEANANAKLNNELANAKIAMDAIPKDQVTVIAAAKEKYDQLTDAVADSNLRLETQRVDLVQLGQSIDAYSLKISNAKIVLTGFAKTISDSFDAASRSASKLVSGDVGNGVDTVIGRLLGNNQKVNQNIFSSGITNFVSTFVKSMIGTSLDSLFSSGQTGIAGFLNNLLGGNKDTALGKLARSTDTNGLRKGGRVIDPSNPTGGTVPTGTLSSPVAVTMVSQTGTNDVGQETDDNTSTLSLAVKQSASTPSASASSGIATVAGMLGLAPGDLVNGGPSLNANGQAAKLNAGSLIGGGALAFTAMTTGDNPVSSALGAAEGVSQVDQALVSGTTGGLSTFLKSAGPYGEAAAAIYGLFAAGAPSRNPVNQPNLYEAGYGQFVTDLNGGEGNFGNGIVSAQAQYNKFAGNQDLSQQLYTFLSSPGASSTLDPDQMQKYNQLAKLDGGDPQGLAIKDEKNDVYTLNSGQQINVEQYQALVQSVTTMMGTFTQNATTAAEDANRLAASFTAQQIGAPAGFTMPTGINSAASGIMPNGSAATRTTQPVGQVPVTINILQGAQVTQMSSDDIVNAVSDALPTIQTQVTQLVNAGNYQNARVSGNYSSQTL